MNSDAGEEGEVAQPVSPLGEPRVDTMDGGSSFPDLAVDKETLAPSQERTELPMATDEPDAAEADLGTTDETPEERPNETTTQHRVQMSNASSDNLLHYPKRTHQTHRARGKVKSRQACDQVMTVRRLLHILDLEALSQVHGTAQKVVHQR